MDNAPVPLVILIILHLDQKMEMVGEDTEGEDLDKIDRAQFLDPLHEELLFQITHGKGLSRCSGDNMVAAVLIFDEISWDSGHRLLLSDQGLKGRL